MADESTKLSALIGARSAGPLAKARELHTVGDLLEFWPRRYLEHTSDLSSLHNGMYVVAVAEVKSASTRRMQKRRGEMLNVTITDGKSDVDLAFFKAWGHKEALVPGVTAVFAGEVGMYRGRWQLTHPAYQVLEGGLGSGAADRGPIPVYLQVKGMQNWSVAECVRIVFDHLETVPEPLPATLRSRHGLPGRLEALRGIHVPREFSEVQRARHRLRYEEAFVFQTLLAQRRAQQAAERTRARTPREGGLLAAFDARLPFELTAGQCEVGEVLSQEMARDTPMHRLLQGEVGSGKTVIALRAMLAAVDAGAKPRCSRRRRSWPRSTTGPSRPCSATSPRAACSAAATSEPGRPPHRQPVDGGPPAEPPRRGQRRRRHRHRDPRPHPGAGAVPGPRPGRRRRAAPLRRRAAGCPAGQGSPAPARPGHDGYAHPAHGDDDGVRRHGDLHPQRAAARPLAHRDARRARRQAGLGAAHVGAHRRGGAIGRQAYVVCPRIGDESGSAGSAAASPDDEEIAAPEPGEGEEAAPREMASVYAVEATLRDNPALAACPSRCSTAGWRRRTRTR